MCAQSNFDLVVKVPLLIKAPWKAATSAGKKTACLVDLVDVGVTVAVLAGLPPPAAVDGKDVSALLDDPTAEPKQKQPAFHQYPACGCNVAAGDPYGTACFNQTRAACNNANRKSFNHMVHYFLVFLQPDGHLAGCKPCF